MSTEIQNKENNNLVPIIETTVPEGLTSQQTKELDNLAEKSIVALIDAKGDIFSEEADKVTNVGLQDQRNVSSGIQLMQEKLGNVFYSKEKSLVSDNMSKDIREFQDILGKINPKMIQKEARFRIIRMIPFLGNYIVSVLKESSSRGMTLQNFAMELEESLKKGDLDLRQDNAQLKVINDDLKQKKLIIASNAYLAEKQIEILSEKIKDIKDEATKNNLNEILASISSRAQNIRATENIIQQFAIQIKQERKNNDYILEAGREMQTNGVMVVNVSLAIHSALIRSKNVKDVVVGTGQFIGKLLVSNATLINNMVTEIGDIRKNPIIPMKMMEDAIAQLQESIDKTNKLNLETITNSKENIAKIKVWTEEIKNKSGELPNVDIKSLEASKTLLLK